MRGWRYRAFAEIRSITREISRDCAAGLAKPCLQLSLYIPAETLFSEVACPGRQGGELVLLCGQACGYQSRLGLLPVEPALHRPLPVIGYLLQKQSNRLAVPIHKLGQGLCRRKKRAETRWQNRRVCHDFFNHRLVTHGARRHPGQLLHVEFRLWPTELLASNFAEHRTQVHRTEIWRMAKDRERTGPVRSGPSDLSNRVRAGKAEHVECW